MMAFNEQTFHRPATRGDVGFNAYLAQNALTVVLMAIEKLAARSGSDVSEELKAAKDVVEAMRREFDELTGWNSDDDR